MLVAKLTILMDKQIEKNKRKAYFIIAIMLNLGILKSKNSEHIIRVKAHH